jgi:hypothetical protein
VETRKAHRNLWTSDLYLSMVSKLVQALAITHEIFEALAIQ